MIQGSYIRWLFRNNVSSAEDTMVRGAQISKLINISNIFIRMQVEKMSGKVRNSNLK